MDFSAVLAQLNDLPLPFKRPIPPYTQLIESLAAAMARSTIGMDGTVNMVQDFDNALNGWMDVWGELFGLLRNTDEGDSTYHDRISATILAWVGTLPALQKWMTLFAYDGTATDNLPAVGYQLIFSAVMTTAQIQAVVASLNRIRPAGVPFTVMQKSLGLYLGTVNFLGEGRMPGSYLGGGLVSVPSGMGPLTNNSQPLVPDLMFTDPTLNPTLS